MPFRSIALARISLNFLSRPFRSFIRYVKREREGEREKEKQFAAKTNSTIIESSIRLRSIFQSRYYLPEGRFISRCDSVATVFIPSPSFFFTEWVFDIYFLATAFDLTISDRIAYNTLGSIKYSSIRPTSHLETCNNFVFTRTRSHRIVN